MDYLKAMHLVKKDNRLRRKAWKENEFIHFDYNEGVVMKSNAIRMYKPTKEDVNTDDWEVC